jgi:hypothetical protein
MAPWTADERPAPVSRLATLAVGLALAACHLVVPPTAVDPQRIATHVTCGHGSGFSTDVLDGPADAEAADDPASEALRRHLAEPGIEIDSLPDTGWREVSRTGSSVMWIAEDPQAEGSWIQVTGTNDGGEWRVTGWGGCGMTPDVGPGLGIANFRVAPHEQLTADTVEIDVLVTERACNSGEDARGRIVEPAIVAGADSVTVVFAVRPRLGVGQTCPSNPETPFLLVLPEPLGDRTLVDGSAVPPRDATTCPDVAACP